MSLFGKLVISFIVAAVAAAICSSLELQSTYISLFAAFAVATIATSLLGSIKSSPSGAAAAVSTTKTKTPKQAKAKSPKPQKVAKTKSTGGKREEGEVKWFNVSKGFGFITRDNGEEIFVHFRSILGEGRRSLRDGQRVSFVVADSDKGLQAEEVDSAET
jgi:CspA family cold shock protein